LAGFATGEMYLIVILNPKKTKASAEERGSVSNNTYNLATTTLDKPPF
jgi:hypothetical protein